jgi:flagellar basal-body rod protein FlgB
MNDWITTSQMPALEKYLDLAAFRQRLVSNNLANIDTPGFTAQDINFEAEMLRALATDGDVDSTLPGSGEPEVQQVAGLVARPDGNNVSVDRESALLAETQLRFLLGSQLLRRQFASVRNAIQEGRGI